uniref:TNFAIP3-interacting protein 1-like isoform X1 n=2 Tax=Myxine glutinosa TaxID=7769 RepID=UPI00358E09B6
MERDRLLSHSEWWQMDENRGCSVDVDPMGKTTKGFESTMLQKNLQTLQKQRKELLQVNKEWDDQYHAMKDSLHHKLQEMRKKTIEHENNQAEEIARLASLVHLGEAQKALQQEDLSEALIQNGKLQEGLCQANKMRAHLHSEIARLNKQVVAEILRVPTPSSEHDQVLLDPNALTRFDCITAQNKQLKEQVMAMNKEKQQERTAAEQALNEHEKLLREFAELKAEMDGARYQLTLYESDFKQERAERKRLQKKLHEREPIVKLVPRE